MELQAARGSDDGAGPPAVGPRVDATREPLGGLVQQEPTRLGVRTGGAEAQPLARLAGSMGHGGVKGVRCGLHEQDAQVRIVTEKSRDEMLVAAPHLVPRLQGHEHHVRHRTSR